MAKFNVSKMEKLKKICTSLLSDNKKFEKHVLSRGKTSPYDMSRAQSVKSSCRIQILAEEIERNLFRFHVLAVECGLADLREEEFYEDSVFKSDGCDWKWHRGKPEMAGGNHENRE